MYAVQNSKGTKRYLAKTLLPTFAFCNCVLHCRGKDKTHFVSDLNKHALLFFKSVELF